MFKLNCYFFKKKKILTVGDVQTIFCPINKKEKKILQNQTLVKQNYPIKLLDYKLALINTPVITKDLLSLQVSFYTTGVFKNTKPVLRLTKDSFILTNLEWKTKSLLQKTSKAQSFYGPLITKNSLSVLYLSSSLLFLFILYSLYKIINKYKYTKIQKQQIAKYQTTVSAYHQYHKTIRSTSIESKQFFVLIQKALFVYLTQSISLPFFKYSLHYLKKKIITIKYLNLALKKDLIFLLEDLKSATRNTKQCTEQNTTNNTVGYAANKKFFLNKTNSIVDQIEESL